MPKRFMLAMGLLTILVTRTYGQETATPPNHSAAVGAAKVESPIADTLGEVFSFIPSDGDRWFTADFLLGWIEGAHLPPLVTTSPVG